MDVKIEFETPENVLIRYQPAGLGTRFLAWVTDILILGLIIFFTIIFLMLFGAGLIESLGGLLRKLNPALDPSEAPMYLLGLILLLVGLGSFLYFGLSEYLMRGQTIGKRQVKIRVVKVDGFTLDAGSILVRNLFRVLDHIPLLWIVPILSSRSQRLGDMVAGTVIVLDEAASIGGLREQLLAIPAAERKFHFDGPALARLRPNDIEALEQVLERWGQLSPDQQQRLTQAICEPLAERLRAESPAPEDYLQFMRDLLAAEYARQYRQLSPGGR